MKVAVIGIGYWGIKHVEEYIALGHDVIVCDPDERNISTCKTKFNSITIQNLLLDDEQLKSMSKASFKLGKPKATSDIVDEAIALIK